MQVVKVYITLWEIIGSRIPQYVSQCSPSLPGLAEGKDGIHSLIRCLLNAILLGFAEAE